MKQEEDRNQQQGKIKVAAYGVVTKNQDELDYESQKRYYTDKIKANPDWKIVGIFIDDKTVGTEADKRIEFNKMLELCRQNKVDMIIAESVSKFAWNTLEMLQYTKELKDYGVDVYFEKQNLHTITSDGEYFATKYDHGPKMQMGL